ncbi:hypothetical protein VR45_29100 [Streptomyces sp. NRRL S-495]|nr:hypothetical protein VR45_29100 [Streptomyces sp. NRRL S-495]
MVGRRHGSIPGVVIYDERLSVPLRWWLAALVAAGALAAALLPLSPVFAVAAGAVLSPPVPSC